MKSLPILLALVATVTSIFADPAATPALAPAKATLSIEEVQKQLIDSLNEDVADIKKADPNPRATATLGNVIHSVQGPRTNRSVESLGMSHQRMLQFLAEGGGSQQSRKLLERFQTMERQEILAAKEKAETGAVAIGRDILHKALAADKSGDIRVLRGQLQEQVIASRNFQDDNLSSQLNKLNNFLDSLISFKSLSESNAWSPAARALNGISTSLLQLTKFIAADEAKAYLEKTRKDLGILPPADMRRSLNALLEELFDDANQDRLDDIKARIQKLYALTGDVFESQSDPDFASQVSAVNELAASFIQNVQMVKNGGQSRFAVDRDAFRLSGSLPKAEIEKRLKNYKVKVVDSSGAIRLEPMRLDAGEILQGITSLPDLQVKLSDLTKAVRQNSQNSEQNGWQGLLTTLTWIAETHALLESGIPFELPRENQGYFPLGSACPAPDKLNELKMQLQLAILMRCFPDAKPKEGLPFRNVLAALIDDSLKARRYADVSTLNRLAIEFMPSRSIISMRDAMAIEFYLAGIRQDDLLQEPRLATYYLQHAAAITTPMVPLDDIKARLQKLKQTCPADYQKGIDDCLKNGMDNASIPQTAAPFFKQFMVPGKSAAK